MYHLLKPRTFITTGVTFVVFALVLLLLDALPAYRLIGFFDGAIGVGIGIGLWLTMRGGDE